MMAMSHESLKVKNQVEVWVYRYEQGRPIFLILKRMPERGDFWQPITGGIEPGETPMEAAQRELFEETGISSPLYMFDLNCTFCFLWDNRLYTEHVFGVEAPSEKVILSPEHYDFRWADLETASALLRWEANRMMMYQLNDLLSTDKNG